MVFLLLFLTMAVYYGVRMFRLIPWYDELYTYCLLYTSDAADD